MKIGIIGTRGIPNHYGGFEQFAQMLAPALVKKSFEVYIYNSKQHPYQQNEWEGVKIIHCNDPEYKWGTVGQFFYDRNCIQDARKRNFDVLLHFGYSSDSLWWKSWPRQSVNIVNMDGLEWKRTKYNVLTRRFLRSAEAWAARHSDQMIADSIPLKEYLFKKYQKEPVYIPYSAEIFRNGDPQKLEKYKLRPGEFYLLIARMERENNIEMIIRGWLDSNRDHPLLVIGSTGNKYGKWLTKTFKHPQLFFTGAIYDQHLLNNLRFYSSLYFHGHSVGGTNPSLLEAMACGCSIAAHNNVFNRAVLDNDALYFSDVKEVTAIMQASKESHVIEQWKQVNMEKIRTTYNREKIVDAYEGLIRSIKNEKSITT